MLAWDRYRLGVLAFAVLTRLAYLADFRDDAFYEVLLADAARYDRWAQAIAAGREFEPGAYYQAPLYPYLLGALYRVVGPSLAAVYAVQMALGVLVLVLVGRVTERAHRSYRAASASSTS